MMKKTAFGLVMLSALFILSSCEVDDASDSTSESTSEVSIDPTTEFTVTFDLNYSGATGTPAPQTVLYNNLVTEPDTPVRTDYTFKHWSTDLYGMEVWNFSTDTVTADMTLYAAWDYSYVEPPIETKMYYLNAPAFWLADGHTAGMYVWSDEDGAKKSWPGEKMTLVEGEIFSLEIPVNYDKILFVRLTAAGLEPEVGLKSQTSDLDLTLLEDEDINFYTVDETPRYGDSKCRGRWSVYPNEPEPYPIEETKTIYVDIPAYWHTDGDVAGIYLAQSDWTPLTGWPGEMMTLVSGEIYRFEVPESYTRVIFNKMTTSGGEPLQAKKAQTEDLLVPTDDNNLFTMDETVSYMPTKCSGTWSTYTPE